MAWYKKRTAGLRRGAEPNADLVALIRFAERSFPGRCVRRFVAMEGIDRSLVLASQALTALIPILILGSTLAPSGDEDAVADAVIRTFNLDGDSAQAVDQLFTIPPDATQSLSVASALLLFFSGLSFTRRLQRMYLSAWDRTKTGVRGGLFAALGLLALLVEAFVLYAVRALVRNLPLDWVLMIPLSVATGMVLWTSIPWLLMNREVHWRRLLAAGVVSGVAISVYGVATAVYMPKLVEKYTNEFGLFGITIALIGWLLAISLVVVGAAAIGAEFDRSRGPWIVRVKERFNLYDPAIGVLPDPAESSELEAEAPGANVNPLMIGRVLVHWLIITLAVWVTVIVSPQIEVTGGLGTLLWVSLLFGLVNTVVGPVAHLAALPLTRLTLGLFTLVVNGLLLALTAGLSSSLSVGGFLSTVLGALVLSIVAGVVSLVLNPFRARAATGPSVGG